MNCKARGHDVVALANLYPEETDELDSYMYQSVGHDLIEAYAQCLGLPLFRRPIKGTPKNLGSEYAPEKGDEVEDMFDLVKSIQQQIPDVQAVCSGAILSSYQKVRVENMCNRLGLESLAYLWERNQQELLDEMISMGTEAILIKVATMGIILLPCYVCLSSLKRSGSRSASEASCTIIKSNAGPFT